jgi:hypothetical protein
MSLEIFPHDNAANIFEELVVTQYALWFCAQSKLISRMEWRFVGKAGAVWRVAKSGYTLGYQYVMKRRVVKRARLARPKYKPPFSFFALTQPLCERLRNDGGCVIKFGKRFAPTALGRSRIRHFRRATPKNKIFMCGVRRLARSSQRATGRLQIYS